MPGGLGGLVGSCKDGEKSRILKFFAKELVGPSSQLETTSIGLGHLETTSIGLGHLEITSIGLD